MDNGKGKGTEMEKAQKKRKNNLIYFQNTTHHFAIEGLVHLSNRKSLHSIRGDNGMENGELTKNQPSNNLLFVCDYLQIRGDEWQRDCLVTNTHTHSSKCKK